MLVECGHNFNVGQHGHTIYLQNRLEESRIADDVTHPLRRRGEFQVQHQSIFDIRIQTYVNQTSRNSPPRKRMELSMERDTGANTPVDVESNLTILIS